jgi:hypothetical protein
MWRVLKIEYLVSSLSDRPGEIETPNEEDIDPAVGPPVFQLLWSAGTSG